jgi:hypothetical protein
MSKPMTASRNPGERRSKPEEADEDGTEMM